MDFKDRLSGWTFRTDLQEDFQDWLSRWTFRMDFQDGLSGQNFRTEFHDKLTGQTFRTDFIYSVFCHPSSVICHPSSVIRHLSSVICHLSSVICHPSSVIRHLLTIYLLSAHALLNLSRAWLWRSPSCGPFFGCNNFVFGFLHSLVKNHPSILFLNSFHEREANKLILFSVFSFEI